jgi:hypothetical protein
MLHGLEIKYLTHFNRFCFSAAEPVLNWRRYQVVICWLSSRTVKILRHKCQRGGCG